MKNQSLDTAAHPTPRVAIYARFSSDLQRDASIDDQIRVCRARADKEPWHIVQTFSDFATSGATTLRPGYQAMLAAVRNGEIDIVLAESLDRFSRDLEHIASFHKQCVFHQVCIHTLCEGQVSELHIGLKGTMGALYLKDLATKTRRGLEGRINAGRLTGSPAYGYSVVRKLTDDGDLDRGLRAVDEDRAVVVRRIFQDYATGTSPRKIAQALNAEGVPSPGGGGWYDASILGRAKRGDGLLRNELYIGRIVWRRRLNAKDPMTGKALRRDARPDTYLTKDVPHLRIIDDALWRRVQTRLKLEAAPTKKSPAGEVIAFWDSRRPKHILTGKVVCGACGRKFVNTGQDYLGCRSAAHGSCHNRRTVRRERLEAEVLDLLGRQLMQPALVAEFVTAFNEELGRLAGEQKGLAAAQHRERAALDRKIANLVDAISDGRASQAILTKLAELEGQRTQLAHQVAAGDRPTHALHPGIAESYATRVAALKAALARGDDPEALESARALIDKVIIHPPTGDGEPPVTELIGDLLALFRTAGATDGQATDYAASSDSLLALFVSSVKMGPGAEPLALPTLPSRLTPAAPPCRVAPPGAQPVPRTSDRWLGFARRCHPRRGASGSARR
jgi:site-specific DNA recombinase